MNDVIHLSTSADLTGYTYTKVYAGTGGSITINGESVTLSAGSSVDILIKSVVGAAGIYLLGNKKFIASGIING